MAAIVVLSILINRSYFQLNPLKPSIYIYICFRDLRVCWHFSFSCAIQTCQTKDIDFIDFPDFIIDLLLLTFNVF